MNECPDMLVWSEATTAITATVPGLYRLSLGFFTHATVIVQICLNGEPVLTLAPSERSHLTSARRDSSNSALGSNGPAPVGGTVAVASGEAQYSTRRSRHSTGDVTSVALDEFLALPNPASLSIRFESPARAQAFFALQKL